MSLTEYTRKRRFDKTPEPSASEKRAAASEPQFCVQRHHATHLHYDLRLEVGGVLKSWAVPKGPTLDPSKKPLAMMTEDHPLEYSTFEGVIPKGNYGAGSMMLWDQGTYELLGDVSADEQLNRGDFKFRLNGQKLKGDFAIVRMKNRGKGNEWLLIKKKDAFAVAGWDPEEHDRSVSSGRTQEEIAQGLESATPVKDAGNALPEITPMKAQLASGEPRAREGWIYEVKWDGVRAVCYIEQGRLRLVSRTGHSMERQYPELSILPHHVKAANAILDGEIAALDERGLPSFNLLQRRITVGDAASVARLSRSSPVVLYLFDLMYLNGRDLRGEPLLKRKELLREILSPSDLIRFSEHFTDGAMLYAAAQQQGLEGIVAKRADSFYESRRSDCWIKYKITHKQEFVICGYTDGDRDFFGALVLGVYDRGKLVWAGNVGTGFDRKMMKTVLDLLTPLVAGKSPLDEPDPKLPRATWVRPEVVCEVRYSQWTPDAKLRAPSFMGLRTDIDPRECVREEAEPARREPLLPSDKVEVMLTVDGHRLKFTNLNKVFWPAEGYTKRDLINYYDAVSPLLLPHLKDRALSLKRYPNGIQGEYFFQKEAAGSFPKWLRTSVVDEINYVIGEDRATLLFLANLGCIDHNPSMSRVQSSDHPDFILIDLDPQDCGFEKIVEAALIVRKKLEKLELESYPKTTGGDGMHLYIPLEPIYTFEQARAFAQVVATVCASERPDLFTTPRAVSRRDKGKVYFDWMQIGGGKTISAPYVLRPHPGAPVATPLAWREVTPKLSPGQFHIRNVLDRFERLGDLFEGVLKKPQKLDGGVLDRLHR